MTPHNKDKKVLNMVDEAILRQLDYTPNEALIEQVNRIVNNTRAFDKIENTITK